MSGYGQFCPIAKATELIGEKWTLLVLRELLLGTTRFNDFQRALSRMSPTLLVRRLRRLEECGIIVRKKLSRQRGYEYRLTAAGKELAPLIETLAVWGMRWARSQLNDDELDVEFLMREMQRRVQTHYLPEGEIVICFSFPELDRHQNWWLVVNEGEVDLCTEDPGKEVDLYLTSRVRTMVNIWEGDLDIRDGAPLRFNQGTRHAAPGENDAGLVWGMCVYKDVARGDPELMQKEAD